MTKKVLVVAYYFPPMGMGGVQRTMKFVKYFLQFDWKPTVLTVKDVLYHAEDPGLLSELKGVMIQRSGSLDPLRLARLLLPRSKHGKDTISSRGTLIRNGDIKFQSSGQCATPFQRMNLRSTGLGHRILKRFNVHRFLSAIMIPDTKILWVPHAIAAGFREASTQNYDCVFSTSPPLSGHLVGMMIARRFHIPWIADFRDLWTGDSQGFEKSPFHAFVNRRIAGWVVRKADGIVSVSESIANDLKRLSPEKEVKSAIIPNGYDPDDFKNVPKESTGKLVFAYGGTFNRDIHPGVFLSALSTALEKQPDLKKCTRIRFAGQDLERTVGDLVGKLGLEPWVELTGYQDHKEWIRTMVNSDVLLLFLPKHAPDGMVTGKIYEYLASGKPIMAMVPKGQASRNIVRYGRGVVIDPEDQESMVKEILRIHELWERGDLVLDTEVRMPLPGLSRIEQTRELVHYFESFCKQ